MNNTIRLLLDPDVDGDQTGGSDGTTVQEHAGAPDSTQVIESTEQSQQDTVQQTQEDLATGTQESQVLDENGTVGQALEQFNQILKTGKPLPQGALAATVTQGQPSSRKLEGLEPHEQAWFKKMGNEAYNALYPEFLSSKKLKTDYEALKLENEKLKGAHLYDEPDAFSIMPEYRELESTVGNLNAEASHWQEQLVRAKAGEEWVPLVLSSEGKVVYGNPQPGTPMAEAQIMSALTKAYTLQQNYSGKLESYKSSFADKNKAFATELQETEKRIFAGADMVKLSKAAESKLSIFPAHIQRQPITQSLAKALVIIDGLTAMLNKHRKTATSRSITGNIARQAGPVNDRLSGGSSGERKVGDVMKDFRAARAQGLA